MTELMQGEACLKLFFLSCNYSARGRGVGPGVGGGYWQLNALLFLFKQNMAKGSLDGVGEGRQADVASYLMGANSKVGGSRDP